MCKKYSNTEKPSDSTWAKRSMESNQKVSVLLNKKRFQYRLYKTDSVFYSCKFCLPHKLFWQSHSQSSQLEEDDSFSPAVCLLHTSAVRVILLLQLPATTLTEKMLPPEWIRIFRIKAQSLKRGDSWYLEYDENIEPDNLDMGWKQYIRNTGARSVWFVYSVWYIS